MDTRTTGARHPHNTSLGELAQAYLYHVENTLRPVTFTGYASSIRLFVAFAGDIPADEVTDLQIVQWMRLRLSEGKSPNTVRSDHRRLRYGIFSWALERGYVSRNWAALAKPPAEPDEPGRTVTEQDFARLLMFAKESACPHRDKAILWTLWDTGMRIGELGKLTLGNVIFEGDATINLPSSITKTSQERWVPIRDHCRAALYDYLAFERGMEPGALFLSSRTGKALHEQTAKHIVREIGQMAGLKVGAHDFRRALVERLQREQMPDSLIMQITGHRSTSMIVKYGKRAASENAILAYRKALGR